MHESHAGAATCFAVTIIGVTTIGDGFVELSNDVVAF